MGWERDFAYAGPADIFREHAALSAFENDGARVFDIGAFAGIGQAAYDGFAPVQWPCPKRGGGAGTARLFADGVFPTPSGRARMVALAATAADEGSKSYPLVLNTGRVRDQWHTMTRTGGVPHLMAHTAAPRLALHPGDAARGRIADGGLVRIASADGHAVMRAACDASLRPGEAFLPMHWTDRFASCGPAGRLVHALCDPVSGQPDLKGTRVRVEAMSESWRGLMVRASDGKLDLGAEVYWCKTPVASGFVYELSGWASLSEIIRSERILRQLLQVPDGAELVSYSDPKMSNFRYAGLIDGRLEACVFFGAPGAAFPEADRAAELLGKSVPPVARLSLLAGCDAGAPRGGATVCACFGVGEAAIRDAIHAGNLASTAEIGAALGAGTNCGSCIPELKRLLADSPRLHVAA